MLEPIHAARRTGEAMRETLRRGNQGGVTPAKSLPRPAPGRRNSAAMLAVVGVLALLLSLPAGAAVLTGKVRSLGAQPIYAPPSITSSMVTLQFYVDDGTLVEKGDPVLRIDASAAAGKLQSLHDQIDKTRADNAQKLAQLELDVIDARIALVNARAAKKKAAVDAGIPANLIPAIDYDRYQGTYTSAKRKLKLAEGKLADARAALERQRNSGAIALRQLTLKLEFNQAQVDVATVYAEKDGMVVHSFRQLLFGGQQKGRFEQGTSAFSGARVGSVVSPGSDYAVRAWVLEASRGQVHEGQQVRLKFDALPGASLTGTVTAISGSAAPKAEWGDGRYYQVDIKAEGLDDLALLPGMSARVNTDLEAGTAALADRAEHATDEHASGPLQARGEIYARDSIPVVLPSIRHVWRLNIVKMAEDGTRVKKGQPIVTFAATRLAQRLPSAKSKLAEKQRTLDKLKLALADNKRSAKLDVAKAEAEAEKARRKAQQPEAYVPGIEYKKLVIDRKSTAKVMDLNRQRAEVAARLRKAKLEKANVEVSILQHEVQQLVRSLAKLTIMAPRSGILIHRSDRNGEKYDVGSQVFRGTTIADIPDLDSLAVHASLPERNLTRVQVGQPVTVTLSGGIARELPGHVADIGRSVHSRSRAEPEPVIDLDIRLDADDLDGLKPGQQVQVTIHPGSEDDSA